MLLSTIIILSSCSMLPENFTLNDSASASKIQNKLVEVAGDLDVYRLMISSSDELDTNLEIAHLYYKDGNTYKTKSIHLTEAKVIEDEAETNSAITRSFNNETPVKISKIDFADILSKIEAGKKLIPEEYEYAALNDYDFKFDGKQRDDIFTLNVTKKGEASEVSGRNIVTNYYEIDFELKNGIVVMDN